MRTITSPQRTHASRARRSRSPTAARRVSRAASTRSRSASAVQEGCVSMCASTYTQPTQHTHQPKHAAVLPVTALVVLATMKHGHINVCDTRHNVPLLAIAADHAIQPAVPPHAHACQPTRFIISRTSLGSAPHLRACQLALALEQRLLARHKRHLVLLQTYLMHTRVRAITLAHGMRIPRLRRHHARVAARAATPLRDLGVSRHAVVVRITPQTQHTLPNLIIHEIDGSLTSLDVLQSQLRLRALASHAHSMHSSPARAASVSHAPTVRGRWRARRECVVLPPSPARAHLT
jgi:hypothetical protein